jgi:uncharacterized protein (TIGR01244 family)
MRQKLTRILACVFALCFAASLLAQEQAQEPVLPIKNFLRINSDFCTGGQPALDDLAKLKEQGVRALINLRRPSEYDHAAEEARAKELDLRYFNIPVDPNAPTDEQAEEFLKLMADPANRPAFIHCSAANRVGAFWMIWRVRAQGWTLEEAEKEADRIGLASPKMRAFARDHLARQIKKPSE